MRGDKLHTPPPLRPHSHNPASNSTTSTSEATPPPAAAAAAASAAANAASACCWLVPRISNVSMPVSSSSASRDVVEVRGTGFTHGTPSKPGRSSTTHVPAAATSASSAVVEGADRSNPHTTSTVVRQPTQSRTDP